MPKPLVFLLGDLEIPLHMQKVDRSRLYGSKELEAIDDQDRQCDLATLAGDGRTLVGKGGTGFGWIDADGKWCDKSQLTPHDLHGDPVRPVESSFGTKIKLFDTATPEEYLEHNIRLVYQLRFEGPNDSPSSVSDLSELMEALGKGTIFRFPYSYRGGLEADTGFLLLNDEQQLMFVVGNSTQIDYVGLQSQLQADEADGETADRDLMDFDMI